MPVDYDLVIFGGTAYARSAALQAAGYGARIALVEPPGLFEQGQRQRYLLQGLQQLGEAVQRQAVGERFGLICGGELDWQAILEWAAIAAETQLNHLSADVMNANGVDVVLEAPKRLTYQLTVITESRRLSARGLLLAFGHLPTMIEKLQLAQTLPTSVGILGGSLEAIEWAWALSDCGVRVKLIADEVLPTEDKDIQRLIRAQLMATGIDVRSACTQPSNDTVKSNDDFQDEADDIPRRHILSVTPTAPALELPGFISLKTNRRMQTNHSRVFACGSILGGSTDEELAQCEANVALQNALFLPRKKINYAEIPQSYSRFARVGLTQTQAENRYGSAVEIIETSNANAACLNRVNPMSDYGKLIFVRHRLVGAHFVGQGARASIRQRFPTLRRYSRNCHSASRLAHRHQWQPGRWRRDWAENWFNWRRSR